MKQMLIFGLGYTASRLAEQLRDAGWRIDATGRDGNLTFEDEASVLAALGRASHVLSSVPPAAADPVLERYGHALAGRGKWLGYLSSTGVYGDTGGAWVDESAPTGTGRRSARSEADAAWLELGARVFRLPGIYGPGRSALDRVREGKARRIDLARPDLQPGPCRRYRRGGDRRARCSDWGLQSRRRSSLQPEPRDRGSLPPAAALRRRRYRRSTRRASARRRCAFYSENRRVANGKAKRVLGWKPAYPTYREGLRSLLR